MKQRYLFRHGKKSDVKEVLGLIEARIEYIPFLVIPRCIAIFLHLIIQIIHFMGIFDEERVFICLVGFIQPHNLLN